MSQCSRVCLTSAILSGRVLFYILTNTIINLPAGFTYADTWFVSFGLQGDFPQIVLQ